MDKFNLLKNRIIDKVYTFGESIKITDEFQKDFFDLVSICTFNLMEGKDNFFGLFTIQLKRKIDIKIKYPVGTCVEGNDFVMYFNPILFIEYTLEEMKALIKHEIYHIMFQHFKRGQELRKTYSDFVVNTVLDMSINQYIENLPADCITIERVNLSFDTDLEYEKTVEYYAERLNSALNKLKGKKGPEILKNNLKLNEKFNNKMDMTTSHDIWDSIDIDFKQIKHITKSRAKNSLNGNMPKAIEKAFKILNKKPEITWSDYFKNTIASMPLGYRKTVTRRDRRQPDRLDIRGKLSNNVVNITIAIDISGSITDKEIEKVMVEVFQIVKSYPYEIEIIECDSDIRRIYKVKSIKDIKKKIDTKGGTNFWPVFRYMNSSNLRNNLLVYFTDGMGEESLHVKPKNYKIFWVLTGKNQKLSLKNPYGEVKKLSTKNIEKNNVKIAIDDMGEIIKDWACAANQYI